MFVKFLIRIIIGGKEQVMYTFLWQSSGDFMYSAYITLQSQQSLLPGELISIVDETVRSKIQQFWSVETKELQGTLII